MGSILSASASLSLPNTVSECIECKCKQYIITFMIIYHASPSPGPPSTCTPGGATVSLSRSASQCHLGRPASCRAYLALWEVSQTWPTLVVGRGCSSPLVPAIPACCSQSLSRQNVLAYQLQESLCNTHSITTLKSFFQHRVGWIVYIHPPSLRSTRNGVIVKLGYACDCNVPLLV